MIYILAGNYQQYIDWLRRNKASSSTYRYIERADRLYGLRDFSYLKVGTWYLRKDIEEIKETIKVTNGNEDCTKSVRF